MHFIPIWISLRFALTDNKSATIQVMGLHWTITWTIVDHDLWHHIVSQASQPWQHKQKSWGPSLLSLWDLMLRHLIKYQNVVIFTYQPCCVVLVCFLARFPPCPAPSCAFYAYACVSVQLVSADGIVQEATINKQVSYDINTLSLTKILISNTLRPRQNGLQFPDDNFKHIFLNENI